MTDRLLHTVEESMRLLSVGRSTLYRLIGEGELETVTIGRRRLIPHDALVDLIDRHRRGAARRLRDGLRRNARDAEARDALAMTNGDVLALLDSGEPANLMDEEARRISEMSDDELESRWSAGTPTKVERGFGEGYYFRGGAS